MSICGWSHDEPCIIVTIGGVEAASSGSGPGYGLVSLDGWEGGAPATGGPVSRELADGGVRGEVYYSPRTLIVEGNIVAADHEDLADKIAALSALGRYEVLEVDETAHTGWVRQMVVARMRPVQISAEAPTFARWTMTLQSIDWRRVDVDERSVTVTPGGVAVENRGTAPAALSLELRGPLANPGLSWPGGAWQYSGTVAAGQTITADLEQRTVRDPATTTHSRNLAAGTWLSLPPGETILTRTGTGSGSITAKWRSSWS